MTPVRRALVVMMLLMTVTACGDDDASPAGASSTSTSMDVAQEPDFMVFRSAGMALAGDQGTCVESVVNSHLNPDLTMYDLIAAEPDLAVCGLTSISELGSKASLEDLGNSWVREFTVRSDTLALMMLRAMSGTPPTPGLISDGECVTNGVRALSDDDLFQLNTDLAAPPFGVYVDQRFLDIAEGCGWVAAE